MPQASSPLFYDWKTLTSLMPNAKWSPGGPMKVDLSYKSDPNPFSLSGQTTFSGRAFSLLASGSPTQVKTIYFDEGGMHPRGEDLLSSLRAQGYDLRLTRCGPVYTESINNWYSVSSPKTRPAMLKQSLRSEGRQVQDAYELRLDATLPKRDPLDRAPGVGAANS